MGNTDFQLWEVTSLQELCYSKSSHQVRDVLISGQTGLPPQILLFGDSITQQSTLTFQARLQELYIRRADIINRGFSGYTTNLALQTLPLILPLSAPQPSPIRLATIFFGANDACLPGNPQHIPLDSYIENLCKIITYPVFKQHNTNIILITPAPINEWQLMKPVTRRAANAAIYAHAVREVSKLMGVCCVDLWSAFMKLAGYTLPHSGFCKFSDGPPLPGSLDAPPSSVLPTLLHDGIHFTSQAYEILFDELMAVINSQIPHCAPEQITQQFEDWKVILGLLPPPTTSTPSPETDSATTYAKKPKEICNDDTEIRNLTCAEVNSAEDITVSGDKPR